jgi:Leucine-rich repeat (LRR) protein
VPPEYADVQVLDLSDNRLTSLRGIEQLTQLKELNLKNNMVTE